MGELRAPQGGAVGEDSMSARWHKLFGTPTLHLWTVTCVGWVALCWSCWLEKESSSSMPLACRDQLEDSVDTDDDGDGIIDGLDK